MPANHSRTAPETFKFEDDGAIPNNPHLALVLYRDAIDLKGCAEPEALVEQAFRRHGWGDVWRNGISRYVHYHSRIHEVMGIARGRAWVRFGGKSGREIELCAGDVVVLPAGTGHQGLWSSPDLIVIGAYPPNGRYDMCRGSKAEHARSHFVIPHVPLPPSDPVRGKNGPLMKLWRTSAAARPGMTG
jgi:uncharacterized protein YjlB